MLTNKLRIEFSVTGFFFLPMKHMEIETNEGTGRVYFLYNNKIVAVAVRSKQ